MSEDQSVQEKNTNNEGLELPVGVQISDVRKKLPSGAQLFLQLRRTKKGQEKDERPVEIDIGQEGFILQVGKKYLVGISSRDSHWVYLNPMWGENLEPADISYQADWVMSKAEWRMKNGQMAVRLFSDDIDLAEIVKRIEQEKGEGELFEKLTEEVYGVSLEIIKEFMDKAVAGIDTNGGEWPEGAKLVIWDQVGYSVASDGANLIKKGKEFEIEELLERAMKEFSGEIAEVAEKRMKEARQRVLFRNEMYVALDTIFEREGVESTLMTTYRPEYGWSVVVPHMDCPAQVAGLLRDLLDGKVNKEIFPTFMSSVNLAIEEGRLEIDTTGKTLVFRGADNLDWTRGVYHGDERLEQAMEVVRMVADPLDGQVVFRQIVLCKEERKWDEPNETIRIESDQV